MNAVLERMLHTGTVEGIDGTAVPLKSNITPDMGAFVQRIVYDLQPDSSIEVGCAYGVSSLFICEALPAAARHTIIDPFQQEIWGDLGWENLKRAGFSDRVTLFREMSYRRLPALESSGARYQFALIDGQHTFDYVLVDFFYIDKMLDVGGVVIFDDLTYPSIRRTCRYILRNLNYESIGQARKRPSAKKRAVTRAVAMAGRLSRLAADDYLHTDEDLGISSPQYIALRKTANNEARDGLDGTRHWTFHRPF